MSALEVRKIPFEFEGVDFIWNPENPGFSVLMNQISFMAIGLEKYFCLAMRDADPIIKNPSVRAEAAMFRAQESVHAQAHKKHVQALIQRYPGLKRALDKSIAHYDALYAREGLNYHLGYAGGLEAAFTPFFKMILENRQVLFGGGDSRVASLFIWHFCEEIEHRSSAITVYNEVVGSSWYRLRNLRSFFSHSAECAKMLVEEFKQHVPDVPHPLYQLAPLAGVSRVDMLRSSLGILHSQMPWHDSEHQPLPVYYQEWLDRYNRGEDMRNIFGVHPQQATAQ